MRRFIVLFAAAITGCSAKPSVPAISSGRTDADQPVAGQSATAGPPSSTTSEPASDAVRAATRLSIELTSPDGAMQRGAFEVNGLSPDQLSKLGDLSAEAWPTVFSVRVAREGSEPA